MSELGNGQILKPRGNYTGERLKSLRPETYRQVVRLLAEPREHVSIREICRRCQVTDDTVSDWRRASPVSTWSASICSSHLGVSNSIMKTSLRLLVVLFVFSFVNQLLKFA